MPVRILLAKIARHGGPQAGKRCSAVNQGQLRLRRKAEGAGPHRVSGRWCISFAHRPRPFGSPTRGDTTPCVVAAFPIHEPHF